MSARSRIASLRRPRLPRRLPRPPRDRPIVVRTAPAPESQEAVVPQRFRAASEWAWRSLIIGVAVLATLKLAAILSAVVFPVLIALLLAALLEPLCRRLRIVLPRGLAAGVTVLGTLAVLIALFSFVANQFASQLDDIVGQVTQGLKETQQWLEQTFGLSESQITSWLAEQRREFASSIQLQQLATQLGVTAGSVITGFFLAMFTLFFFLYDGAGIWAWLVRLFPRGSRAKVLSSGAIAWGQLKAFTHATIVVAGIDAFGIGLGAFVLGVPFVSGVALLVFIGAFIPIIGATVSGFVAVVLAFVAKGPITALLMLAVVIGVQQIESQLLQPLLLGHAVRVHPLAVILGIGIGIIVGGIIGALMAVPLIAVLNAVGHNLLDPTPPDVDHAEELATSEELDEVRGDVDKAEERAETHPRGSDDDT